MHNNAFAGVEAQRDLQNRGLRWPEHKLKDAIWFGPLQSLCSPKPIFQSPPKPNEPNEICNKDRNLTSRTALRTQYTSFRTTQHELPCHADSLYEIPLIGLRNFRNILCELSICLRTSAHGLVNELAGRRLQAKRFDEPHFL